MVRLLLVVLWFFAAAATAHAECAWVLWGTVSNGSFFLPLAGFNARAECEARARIQNLEDEQRFRAQLMQNISTTPDGKLVTEASPPMIRYCLPDTVNPRGPKGK